MSRDTHEIIRALNIEYARHVLDAQERCTLAEVRLARAYLAAVGEPEQEPEPAVTY